MFWNFLIFIFKIKHQLNSADLMTSVGNCARTHSQKSLAVKTVRAVKSISLHEMSIILNHTEAEVLKSCWKVV